MNASADFPACPICEHADWTTIHDGMVRAGQFGATAIGRVARCLGCGVDRLAETNCLREQDYADGRYRQTLGQSLDAGDHLALHDELQRFTMEATWPLSARGKIVADVGCGGGSLLDHLTGLAREGIAIDPADHFATSLRNRGYHYFPSTPDAAVQFAGRVDLAFSIQVIEHVDDPLVFLADVRTLVHDESKLIVSTPNRDDIMMELLPDTFPSFFYRAAHRWYFDADSLVHCASAAGWRVKEVRFVHRYGFANTLRWLRDKQPSGRRGLAAISPLADRFWQGYLESIGRSDTLYVLLEP